MSEKKLLLVDTNVISHAVADNQTDQYTELFSSLESEYKFIVTRFTKYEILRSTSKDHRQRVADYISENFYMADLSQNLMDFSGRIYYLLTKHKLLDVRVSDGDVINAAFAIAKKCAILTIDNTDYPRMLFAEIARHRITYTSKRNKEVIDVLYELMPDIEMIRQCVEEVGA